MDHGSFLPPLDLNQAMKMMVGTKATIRSIRIVRRGPSSIDEECTAQDLIPVHDENDTMESMIMKEKTWKG
jgi:hypothetical protein